MNYSQTQLSNLTSLAGVIVLILNHFKINIGTDDITAFLGAAVTLGGLVWGWFHRYQKGDLTVAGFRKE